MSDPLRPLDSTLEAGGGERALRLEAASLERLLSDAAVAISNLIVEDAEVIARESRWVELDAAGVEDLLGKWVELLVGVLEEEDMLFGRAEVQIHGAPGQPLRLQAKLWGEPYDPQWHPRRREIGLWDPGAMRLKRGSDRRWQAHLSFRGVEDEAPTLKPPEHEIGPTGR